MTKYGVWSLRYDKGIKYSWCTGVSMEAKGYTDIIIRLEGCPYNIFATPDINVAYEYQNFLGNDYYEVREIEL